MGMSVRAGRVLCFVVLLVVLVCSSIGTFEYLRLTERAAGFDERAVAMLQARCRDATPSTRVHMRAGAHRH